MIFPFPFSLLDYSGFIHFPSLFTFHPPGRSWAAVNPPPFPFIPFPPVALNREWYRRPAPSSWKPARSIDDKNQPNRLGNQTTMARILCVCPRFCRRQYVLCMGHKWPRSSVPELRRTRQEWSLGCSGGQGKRCVWVPTEFAHPHTTHHTHHTPHSCGLCALPFN